LFTLSKAVKRATLSLEGIDNVQSSDGLPSGVFRISDRVSDDILEEMTKNPSDLFVDVATDPLHTASAGESADGRLRNALDVLAHNLSMSLRTAFAQTFTTFAAP
jgi:hypothetical protein